VSSPLRFRFEPHRCHQVWTTREIRQLRAMRKAGEGFDEIGHALGRTPEACRGAASHLGIHPNKAPAARRRRDGYIPCLKCRNPFASEGPHNRIFRACRKLNSTVFDNTVTLR
jgi:hypothetical protein